MTREICNSSEKKLATTVAANQHAKLMGRRGLGQRTLARIMEVTSETKEGHSDGRKSQ
jgi:hypothetical protein